MFPVQIENIVDPLAGLQHHDGVRQNPVLDDEARYIVIGDGLLLLDPDHIRDADHGGVGHLFTVLVCIREKPHHLHPAGGAVRNSEGQEHLVALLSLREHLADPVVYGVPAVPVVVEILVAVVVEQGLILLLRVADQLVIEIIGPYHRKMLVHQMTADADLHRPHQQLLLVFHLHQLRHIRHHRVGSAVPVYIFVREITEQFHPVAGPVLILHGDDHLILVSPVFQYRRHLGREQLPSLGIIPVILVGVVVKQRLVPLPRVTDQLIVILVGPHAGKMLVDEMFADADVQRSH